MLANKYHETGSLRVECRWHNIQAVLYELLELFMGNQRLVAESVATPSMIEGLEKRCGLWAGD